MYIGYRDDGLMELSWLIWSHSALIMTIILLNLPLHDGDSIKYPWISIPIRDTYL